MADQELAPDVFRPVVGFRNWKIIGDILVAPITGARITWAQKEAHASCIYYETTGPPPHVGHDCGLYVYTEPQHHLKANVEGVVKCWGKIYVHKLGFRAQHAEIVALGLPRLHRLRPRRTHKIQRIADRYGVPTIPQSKFKSEALKYGDFAPRPAIKPYLQPFRFISKWYWKFYIAYLALMVLHLASVPGLNTVWPGIYWAFYTMILAQLFNLLFLQRSGSGKKNKRKAKG